MEKFLVDAVEKYVTDDCQDLAIRDDASFCFRKRNEWTWNWIAERKGENNASLIPVLP